MQLHHGKQQAARPPRGDPVRGGKPPRLDATSRRHLRIFAGQVGFLALSGLPLLAAGDRAPLLYLGHLRTMFGLSALIIMVICAFSRTRLSPTSLCLWDLFLAFSLLKLACSIALRLLG